MQEIKHKMLKKYSEGRIVDFEDKNYIERFAGTGLMTTGYDIDKKRLTAKTTHLGLVVEDGSIWSNYSN